MRSTLGLDVLDGDVVAADSGLGEGLAVLLDIGDRGTSGGERARVGGGRGLGEGDGAKVRERHGLAIVLKVLDDPLSILLAQRHSRRDVLRDRLVGGEVDDGGRARGLVGGLDGEHDLVVRAERDAGEVESELREPLIPSCKLFIILSKNKHDGDA